MTGLVLLQYKIEPQTVQKFTGICHLDIICFAVAKAAVLLQSYLKQQRSHGVVNTSILKKPKVIKTWDRDILCIPKGTTRTGVGSNIAYPRGSIEHIWPVLGLLESFIFEQEICRTTFFISSMYWWRV